jgi:preprotein translocase subunit SecA
MVRDSQSLLDTALEGVEIEARETGQAISPQAMVDAAVNTIGIEAKSVSREILKPANFREIKRHLAELSEQLVWKRASAQVTFWLERRTGLPPEKATAANEEFETAVDSTRTRLQKVLQDRRDRILQEADEQIGAATGLDQSDALAKLIIALTYRTQMLFDPRSHQRRAVSMARFSWVYLAARLAVANVDIKSGRFAEEIQAHLSDALDALREEWGHIALQRMAETEMATLPFAWRDSIRREADEQGWRYIPEDTPVTTWEPKLRGIAERAVGGQVMASAHRDLILQTVGQAWVEYLTNMEALRTSIGLEAYAQRDPLVQYKSRAVDLYRELMQQVRTGVVSRLFHMSLQTAAAGRSEGADADDADESDDASGRKKRKRHK